MAKYLVFLDIDGVLTSERTNFANNDMNYKIMSKFDPVAIEYLNKVSEKCNVEFVLVSTWKTDMDVDNEFHKHWVLSCFKNSGFRGKFADVWRVEDINLEGHMLYYRAVQIKKYLEDHHKDNIDYLILDDEDFRYYQILGKKRHIKTSSKDGMLYSHMQNINSIIGSWL